MARLCVYDRKGTVQIRAESKNLLSSTLRNFLSQSSRGGPALWPLAPVWRITVTQSHHRWHRALASLVPVCVSVCVDIECEVLLLLAVKPQSLLSERRWETHCCCVHRKFFFTWLLFRFLCFFLDGALFKVVVFAASALLLILIMALVIIYKCKGRKVQGTFYSTSATCM